MGESARVDPVDLELRQQCFPSLFDDVYFRTSEPTDIYNCFAWAAGVNNRWWGVGEDDYWPSGVPRVLTLENLMAAYATVGFVECADGAFEKGFRKIAIYVHPDTRRPTHAALQLSSGIWTSKLGELADIVHGTLRQIEAVASLYSYGHAVRFMRRPVRTAEQSDRLTVQIRPGT